MGVDMKILALSLVWSALMIPVWYIARGVRDVFRWQIDSVVCPYQPGLCSPYRACCSRRGKKREALSITGLDWYWEGTGAPARIFDDVRIFLLRKMAAEALAR